MTTNKTYVALSIMLCMMTTNELYSQSKSKPQKPLKMLVIEACLDLTALTVVVICAKNIIHGAKKDSKVEAHNYRYNIPSGSTDTGLNPWPFASYPCKLCDAPLDIHQQPTSYICDMSQQSVRPTWYAVDTHQN